MTEQEINTSQLNNAAELSRGRIVRPCIAQGRTGQIEICPLLGEDGCSVGFVKEPGDAVRCRENGEEIRITNEPLSEALRYRIAIQSMELKSGEEISIANDALFA
jgi:hypothetical protein